jgi:hypothetical protein
VTRPASLRNSTAIERRSGSSATIRTAADISPFLPQ